MTHREAVALLDNMLAVASLCCKKSALGFSFGVIAMRTTRKLAMLVALLAFASWRSTFSQVPSSPRSFEKVHAKLESLATTQGAR